MSKHKTLFSYEARVLACANCAAPIQAEAAGQSVTCGYCSTPNLISARDESIDQKMVQTAPTMSEAQRFERLRQQDGKPFMPPPAIQYLLVGGGLSPQNVPNATEEWKRARQELMHGGSFAAAERIYFLTHLLYQHLSGEKQDLQVRALLETSLEHLEDPRHRQVLHGMLARNAARVGDAEAAEKWLALCTPHSDDIHMDTGYRFSRAYVSTVAQDYQAVLTALGYRVDDIPIADGSDMVCAVIRANALERTGRAQDALQQLTRMMMIPGGDQQVASILQVNAQLALCQQTYPQARQQSQQTTANIVKTQSGVSIGPIFLVAFGGPLVGLGLGALLDALGVPKIDAIITVGTIVYVVLLLGTIFYSISKGARVRAHLAKVGVQGRAQILGVNQTGTRVNNQPMMELILQVEAPGMQPYRASHREIISMTMMSRIQPGTTVAIIVDPSNPAQLAIQWNQG
jgi:hypothetical protein